MKPFFAALQFLTFLPVGPAGAVAPRDMIGWFPVVGLMVGFFLAGVDAVALRLWDQSTAAVLDVIFLALVTGALHLDGLGDTADGLYGRRPAEKALAIMKDSRIGAMALVTVAAVLALKWSGLAAIGKDRFLLLVLIPAYARGAMLFGIRGLPYGRSAGTGYDLFATPLTGRDFSGLLLVAGLSLLLGWRALFLNFFFAVLVAATMAYYRRKIGCITGDMLGAMAELTESALFLLMAMRVLT